MLLAALALGLAHSGHGARRAGRNRWGTGVRAHGGSRDVELERRVPSGKDVAEEDRMYACGEKQMSELRQKRVGRETTTV